MRFHKPTRQPARMAQHLAQEAQAAIAADPKKIECLARFFQYPTHAVLQAPPMIQLLQRIESLFLSWLDPQTSMKDVEQNTQIIAAIQEHAHDVPISWIFEVMRKVQGRARALKAPDCFFEHSDDFLQRLIQAQETFWMAQQEHFKEEQHYWQAIFNTLTEGVCVSDLDGALYDMNDAYCQLTGYTREELLQRGWLALTAPEYRDEDQKHLPDILAGIVVRLEKAYIHKDGHTVPIFISYRRLKRRAGWDKDRLVVTCVDLSALKTQESLQEERAYWQAIFNLSNSPMIVMDEKGQVIEVNDTYAKIHGYTLEAFKEELRRGASLIEMTVPPERQAEAASSIQAALSSQDGVLFEFVNKTKDGRLFPTLDMLKRIQNRDQQLILLTQIDLTELKAKEQALEAEKNKSEALQAYWQTLFTEAPVGMVVYDVDGHYHQVNPKFCAMTGCSEAELLDPRFDYKTIFAEKLDVTLAHVKNAMESDKPQTEELVIASKNKRVEVLCTSVRLPMKDSQGRPLLASWHQDISELKEREHEIRQLLDDAQTYLQRLAAAMLVHDDRDTAGTAQLLQETYNQSVDNLQSVIGTVAKAAQALMASSEELTQSQASMADRANEESSSLEEISANVEEISSAVAENAQNARYTQELAEEVLDRLAASKIAMNDVVEVVFSAAQSARETTQIAKLIEGIAFTTNILSLNASVEAARAGQHGRGFAVIAEEVRRLALQVGEESQRAQAIIQTLLDAMEKGERGVQQVAMTMDQVEDKSHTMTEHIQAIAGATQEQDEGLKQIAQGMSALEEGLSQNAAMAEEIHGTTISLQEQAEQLLGAVQQFESDRDVTALTNAEDSIASAARAASVAHHRWRQRLLDAMQHGQVPDPEVVGDFHRCAFGQLLDNNKALQSHPDYRRIRQLHQAFHQEGQKIARLLQQGHVQEARQQLLGESHYNELTRALIDALEHLAESKKMSHEARISSMSTKALNHSRGKRPDEWEAF